ncbi:MAG: hypothetical protein ACFCU1_03725 [Sumerlaeia bacterium]
MNRINKDYHFALPALCQSTSPFQRMLFGAAATGFIVSIIPTAISAGELVNHDSVAAAQAKALSSASHPKISSDLDYVVKQFSGKSSKALRIQTMDAMNAMSAKQIVQLDSKSYESIQVYIRVDEVSDDLISTLESLGVEIDVISSLRPIIQAYVPLSKLNEVASIAGVAEVTRPSYSLATAGPNITEGDLIQGTNFIRSGFTFFSQNLDSIDGFGTTIGVISNSLFARVGNETGVTAKGQCNNLQRNALQDELPFPELATDLPIVYYDQFGNPVVYNCPNASDFAQNNQDSGFFGAIDIFPDFMESHRIPGASANSPVQPFRPYPEGAAMLEVVHDIAPSARKLYADGRTSLNLERARQFLVPSINQQASFTNSKNVDVIVDNLVFFSEGRFDGSSAISRQASRLSRTRNIPYFVSVGGQTSTDFRSRSEPGLFPFFVNAYFNPDPRPTRSAIHSWSPNTSFDRDEILDIEGVPGTTLELTLIWDDIWDDFGARATLDFDMYLVSTSGSGPVDLSDAIASSTRTQNGSASNPIEQILFSIGGEASLAERQLGVMIVDRNTGTGSKTFFTLLIENATVLDSQYLTHGVPVNNADALAPVISVGHIDIANSISNLSFTNDVIPGLLPGAPHQTSFFSWYENQSSPDVISYGSVTTAVTGDRGFAGPSSAVSHIAGYAALLRQRFPELPPQRMLELLTDTSGLSDDGTPIVQFATDITPRGEFGVDTAAFNKAPQYLRPNTFALYNALVEGDTNAYGNLVVNSLSLASAEPVIDENGVASEHGLKMKTTWSQELASADDLLRVSDLGLEIQSNSNRTSRWVSPKIQTHDSVTNVTRSALQPNSEYILEARVGSNNPDPEAIPNFKLKAIDSKGRVLKSLAVNCAEAGFVGSPTSISGKPYQIYFSTPESFDSDAELQIVFESEGASTEEQKATTLFLRDVKLTEILSTSKS